MESNQPQIAPEAKTMPKNPILYFAAGLICVILVVLIGTYVWARQALSVLPAPASALKVADTLNIAVVSVNGEKVPYTTYYRAYERLKAAAASQPVNPAPTEQEISDTALLQVAGTVIMNDVAKKLQVEVTEKDMADAKEYLLTSSNMSEEDTNAFLQNTFGLSLSEYLDEVGRPAILEQKMLAAFASTTDSEFANAIDPVVTARHILFRVNTTTLDAEAMQGAKDTIARLDKGEDFTKLAAELGNDEATKKAGGSLGSFGPGRLMKTFEDAVFALKTGEYSKEPIKTEFGYHVVRVDERRDERNLGAYVRKQVKDAKIKVLLPIHSPFDELQKSL